MRRWIKRCGNAIHQEIFEIMILKPLADSFGDFGHPKQPYRASKCHELCQTVKIIQRKVCPAILSKLSFDLNIQ